MKKVLTDGFEEFANHTCKPYSNCVEKFVRAAQADILKVDEHLQQECLDEETLYSVTRERESKHLKECFELWAAADNVQRHQASLEFERICVRD